MRSLYRHNIAMLTACCLLSAGRYASAERPSVIWQVGGHSGGVTGLEFSPDGTILASTSHDSTTKLWRVTDGGLSLTLGGYAYASQPSFSPDGNRVLYARTGGGFEWNIADATLHRYYCCMESGGVAVQSPDGALVAVGGSVGGGDLTTIVYDHATGTDLYQVDGSICAFSADGTLLYTAGSNVTMRQASTGQLLTDQVLCITARSLAVSDSVSQVAVGCESGIIYLLDANDLHLVAAITTHTSRVEDLAYSPDGSRLAAASHDGTVTVWSVADQVLLYTLQDHDGPVDAVAWSPDGALLATGGGGLTASRGDKSIRLRDAATGAVARQVTVFHGAVHDISLDDAGQSIAGAVGERSVTLRRAADGALLRDIPLSGTPLHVAMSPNGAFVAASDFSGAVAVYSTVDGALISAWQAHSQSTSTFAWHPDGGTLLTSAFGDDTRQWDPLNGTQVGTLPIDNGGLKYSRDGASLAGADFERVFLFNGETGEFVRLLAVGSAVDDYEFSRDSSKLIVAARDRSVRVFDVNTGALLHTLTGHESMPNVAALSNNGAFAASASGNEQSLRIWDVAAETTLATYDSQIGSSITEMYFSPDDRRLFLARQDGAILSIRNPVFHEGDQAPNVLAEQQLDRCNRGQPGAAQGCTAVPGSPDIRTPLEHTSDGGPHR